MQPSPCVTEQTSALFQGGAPRVDKARTGWLGLPFEWPRMPCQIFGRSYGGSRLQLQPVASIAANFAVKRQKVNGVAGGLPGHWPARLQPEADFFFSMWLGMLGIQDAGQGWNEKDSFVSPLRLLKVVCY